MIAALFVETGGCYYGLPGVDPWDRNRDARAYAGPWPVVAHPPCERWGRFAARHGGTLGDDGGCFEAALEACRRFGGVIEHPAYSAAWARYGLPKPSGRGWTATLFGEWVCLVEQGHYGYPARKATWLFACGCRPPDLVWGPAPQMLPAKRLRERGYESARRCGAVGNMSSKARQRTPLAFRDVLIGIASSSPARI